MCSCLPCTRFQAVDNYEYELPSDFEDEEIDEEMAFTAEDKIKYGGWFDKDDDADGAQCDWVLSSAKPTADLSPTDKANGRGPVCLGWQCM